MKSVYLDSLIFGLFTRLIDLLMLKTLGGVKVL
jgi:hypothetical protein